MLANSLTTPLARDSCTPARVGRVDWSNVMLNSAVTQATHPSTRPLASMANGPNRTYNDLFVQIQVEQREICLLREFIMSG